MCCSAVLTSRIQIYLQTHNVDPVNTKNGSENAKKRLREKKKKVTSSRNRCILYLSFFICLSGREHLPFEVGLLISAVYQSAVTREVDVFHPEV